jgi:Mg/Co/Ni transporter MgtE
MNSEFLALTRDMTVDETMRHIRLVAPDIDTVYYAYVIDQDDRLEGVVSLKDLLVAPMNSLISGIMEDNVKQVRIDAEPEEIYHVLTKYNLIAVPVMDEDGKMAGIVTVDDILQHFLGMITRRKRHMHH